MSEERDFIDEFCELILEREPNYDIPEVFVKAAGYWIISSTVGQFFRCPLLPKNDQRPNLWFLLSSIPGRMRRSTIITFAKAAFRTAMLEYYNYKKITPRTGMVDEEVLQQYLKGKEIQLNNLKEEDLVLWRKSLVESHFIEEGTPEGIIDYINATNLGMYCIVSPEFGGVLTRIKQRDYQSGVQNLLSKLYCGEGGTIALSRRGGKKGIRVLPEGLYVTMLAGMQEPKLYLEETDFRQGLMRRIILVYKPKADRWRPPLQPEREQTYWNLEKLVKERLVPFLKEASSIAESNVPPFIDLHFNPSVEQKINEYAKYLDSRLDEEGEKPSIESIYKQGFWYHLTRMAACRALARFKLEKTLGNVTVNPRDYEKARNDLNEMAASLDEMLSKIGELEEPPKSIENQKTKVYRFIKRGGANGVPKTSIRRRFSWKNLDEILTELIEDGRITATVERTGGRPRLIYRAVH